MAPLGGSELQWNALFSKLPSELLKNKNIIKSICDPKTLVKDKINILWEQLSYDQPNVQALRDRKYVDDLDWIIFNSHWSYNQFRLRFKIPEYKTRVLQNFIHPFPHTLKKDDSKIKLIYTSTPWRGLAILMRTVEMLNEKRKDFEVDIYSSTLLYGSNFDALNKKKYQSLFDKCEEIPNINYKGYATNEEVRQALMKSHILAYPCIFEETSCLAAIEAMAAGCKVVTTNYGALPETCGRFARYICFEPHVQRLIDSYVEVLNEEMDNIFSEKTLESLQYQVNHYNTEWSIDTRLKEWEAFLAGADANTT
jgi:UDP-glucose:(glucosyl)LPS alpha-1,2-glucosyltransferase